MSQYLLTALIGFAAGIVPAIIAYLAKQKELSSPVTVMEKVTKAEEALRDDLMKQIDDLKIEVKELKTENKQLREENKSLENRLDELETIIRKCPNCPHQVNNKKG